MLALTIMLYIYLIQSAGAFLGVDFWKISSSNICVLALKTKLLIEDIVWMAWCYGKNIRAMCLQRACRVDIHVSKSPVKEMTYKKNK